MTLSEYLKSPRVVEDARRLLDRYQGNEWPNGCDSSSDFALWSAKDAEAWTMVEVSQIQTLRLRCYYRPEGTCFLVTDCAECVAEVMRRTGKRWRQAVDDVVSFVADPNMCMAYSPDVERLAPTAEGLPAAIVSVLSAIARVREAQP